MIINISQIIIFLSSLIFQEAADWVKEGLQDLSSGSSTSVVLRQIQLQVSRLGLGSAPPPQGFGLQGSFTEKKTSPFLSLSLKNEDCLQLWTFATVVNIV